MKINYDKECDANYLKLSDKMIKSTREFRGIVNIDTDIMGNIVGIEFIGDGPIEKWFENQ